MYFTPAGAIKMIYFNNHEDTFFGLKSFIMTNRISILFNIMLIQEPKCLPKNILALHGYGIIILN